MQLQVKAIRLNIYHLLLNQNEAEIYYYAGGVGAAGVEEDEGVAVSLFLHEMLITITAIAKNLIMHAAGAVNVFVAILFLFYINLFVFCGANI